MEKLVSTQATEGTEESKQLVSGIETGSKVERPRLTGTNFRLFFWANVKMNKEVLSKL